jgi:hypothetical protein
MILEGIGDVASALQKKRERKRKNGADAIRPNQDLLERVTDKQAKRKAEEEASTHKPSKAACDREERIAEVQLKAYWACFPLDTSTADEECSGDAKNLPGRTEAAAPKDQSNKGRKQLLATLRSSIIEKGQAEANKKESRRAAEVA